MSLKALRLDVDGVLVRDRLLLEHVKDNCVNYVRAKLPDCKDPRETNRLLYLAHGHTARGLQTVFKVDVKDFNTKVYDRHLMDHLATVLSSYEFQSEAQEIHNLTREGWTVSLFTNSPWIWAYKVALAIGDNVNVRCGGNPTDSPLKPDPEAYLFNPNHMNVFVDDSLKNLGTARYMPNWKCVHFTDQRNTTPGAPKSVLFGNCVFW